MVVVNIVVAVAKAKGRNGPEDPYTQKDEYIARKQIDDMGVALPEG